MRQIIISGKFLTKPVNGIPRYANEVVKHLDDFVVDKDVTLYMPQGVNSENLLQLHNIKIIQRGNPQKGWDNLYPERYAKKNNALYLNLCSQGVLYKNSIVCLHDIRPSTWDKANNVKLKSAWTYALKCKNIAKNARSIVTDSEFCREEIASHLNVDKKYISVIPIGWEHINNIIEVINNIDMNVNNIFNHKYL